VKGRFKSVEDLLNVRGIGEAKLAAIRSRVGV
jgi:DNA uptake protein ComE-like DNA-binding protein